MTTYANDVKPGLGSISILLGNPIGLLLALTYASSIASPGEIYTNDTEPTTSYSNDLKP